MRKQMAEAAMLRPCLLLMKTMLYGKSGKSRIFLSKAIDRRIRNICCFVGTLG